MTKPTKARQDELAGMREIKFRAYNEQHKKWDYFTLDNIPQYLMTFQAHLLNGSKFYQFTGLLDKDGTEIYEGDWYHINLAGFGIEKDLLVEWEDGKYKEPMFEDYHRKVIGNIYENPELLNQ